MAKQVLTKLFMSVQFFSFFHLGKINMFITLKAYKTSTVLQGCKNTNFFSQFYTTKYVTTCVKNIYISRFAWCKEIQASSIFILPFGCGFFLCTTIIKNTRGLGEIL